MRFKYIKNQEDLSTLAKSDELKAVKLIMEAVSIKEAELKKELIERPRECPDNITNDFRAVIGKLYLTDWILTLTTKAREHLSKFEGE